IDNQYRVTEKHYGGMSVVYIVLDEFSQRRFAVKTLKQELLDDRNAASRFAAEARTWMNLGRHENIVEAIIYREIDGQPFLFLEYVEGASLQVLLDLERHLFPPQLVTFMLQVCAGMAYVHNVKVGPAQTGVIHRDIKPANLMLTREAVIKITDFGLAKAHGMRTEHSDVGIGLGTYLYMPPEQLLDASTADRTSDIYSFGVAFYAAITGRAPIQGHNVGQIVRNIINQEPLRPSQLVAGVPRELEDLILRCLAKKREDRFQSFEEVRVALEGVREAVTAAHAGRDDVRQCRGCSYLTTFTHRACPLCANTFELVAFPLGGGAGSEAADGGVRAPALQTETADGGVRGPALQTEAADGGVRGPALQTETADGGVRAPALQPEGAAEGVPEAAELSPEEEAVQVLLQTARSWKERDDLQRAVNVLRQAVALAPGHVEARRELDETVLEMARRRPRTPTKAYNWPMFRGNITRTGYTPEIVAPPLQRRWQYKVGDWVMASPVVSNAVAFVGGHQAKPAAQGRFVAVHCDRGQLVWELETPHEILLSACVLGGNMLFVASHNWLMALDPRTGRRYWDFTASSPITSAPTAWQNMVYFGTENGTFYALHAQSGQRIWTFGAEMGIYSAAMVWEGCVYFGSSDHRLYAVEQATGALTWEFMSAGEISSTPLFHRGRIYVGSSDQRLYCLDYQTGRRVWEFATAGAVNASPAASQDIVYVGSRDRNLYAVAADTGTARWHFSAGDWIDSSPAVSGRTVYVGSHDGKLYALEAETGILMWEYPTDGEVGSSPAVSGGRVVVGGNDGNLYCFRSV
ncbi:MAG: serine/threonine-protein kinase, partial [Armatimonadia bacterium]